MWAQGFRIKIFSALAGGITCFLLLFAWYPPTAIDMSPIKSGMQFTTRDAFKIELAKRGFTWFYPPISRLLSGLPEKQKQAGLECLVEARHAYWQQWEKYGFAGAVGALLFFLMTSWFGRREELARTNDQYVRGAKLSNPKELAKLVKQSARETGEPPPRIHIANVPIPVRNEITPTSILGRPQVGKTTLFRALLDQIIRLVIGKRVIFDSKGDYTQSHWQPGDYIFAPSVDDRSLRWTIFNDITSLSRISDMAAALIPEGGKDPMWAEGAKRILEGLLLHCWNVNKKSNAYLWQVACLPADKLKEVLAATPGAEMAAALLDKPEVQTSFSFTVNLKTYLKPLQLLARMDGPFSIRQWLADEKKDSLFIVSIPDHQEILKPVMNLFLSTLLTAQKSMPDDRNRRVFYLLDELGVLPKVPGLADALNFGPSKGLCAFIGYQSYQQIDDRYGRDTRESMSSAAGTHVSFSVGSEKTLEELSKLIGEAEVIESRSTLSTGITDNRHGGSSMYQLTKRRLVLPDEIKDLQPLNAYIKILG